MIRVNQVKLPVSHSEADLRKKTAKMMGVSADQIQSVELVRQSLDARKKPDLYYLYALDVAVAGKEAAIVKRARSVNVQIRKEEAYRLPDPGIEPLRERPVIVGFGPAGMFCGLMLARAGYRPLILERGLDADSRAKAVARYWTDGTLDPECNVQFGEGGAGTFSEGKLNTLVKDPSGRNKEVLKILAQAGADPTITYVNKPHVGTDVLRTVVKNIRSEIESLGGEVRFGCRLEDFETQNGHLCSIRVSARKGTSEAGRTVEEIPASAPVRVVPTGSPDGGRNATFGRVTMPQPGLVAQRHRLLVGLRIQHPQTQINLSQYGREEAGNLGAASYKLTAQTSGGRGVYSFCMCPGGFVVDASSEPGRLAINGMSNHDRAGANANSALIVTVTPEDFPQPGTLGGVTFQRQLEEAAYRCGGGKIPVQLYGDFRENRSSTGFGAVTPQFEGQFAFGNLREVLPEALSAAMLEGMEHFGHVIHGFDREDAVFAGVESRTSSPLRIPRDHATMESSTIAGIYPCGEGAGYAGGITSAAMDGMKTAEAIIAKYAIPKIKL